jgi:nucleotide-binding universal stress UspA family protein
MGKNILLSVDALHYAPEATEIAKELWRDADDKIIVLHVHEFAVGRFGRLQVDCAEGDAEQLVTSIRASLAEAGISAEAEIREAHVGQVARAIVEAADQHDARLIVLGSAHSTDLPHIPFGSISLKVLHLARRPVIVVPRQAALADEPHVVRIGGAAAAPVTP